MGWFWADSTPTKGSPTPSTSFPAGCPMHQPEAQTSGWPVQSTTTTTTTTTAIESSAASRGCPVKQSDAYDPNAPHSSEALLAASAQSSQTSPREKTSSGSFLSQLNPLNYMFKDISQAPAPNQQFSLPTERENSSILRGDNGSGASSATWEYPSPQQMYHALLRKGHTDTDPSAIEGMVSVHNYLNEGAWAEVVGWEQRFAPGLSHGFKVCSRGEENADDELERSPVVPQHTIKPALVRFQGRPKEMTPKASILQALGWVYPSKFGIEPPFDRHDWYVSRKLPTGEVKEVRYVIDFYSAPPDEHGFPVFFLDVRPEMSVSGAAERFVRWGTDVWWRASGGAAREGNS